jgi:prophage tail gpP-like protein
MSEVQLKANGKQYLGWQSIQVDRSLDNFTSTFGFSSSDKFPEKPDKWNIEIGDTCEVLLASKIIITGYIDEINIDYNEAGHTINVLGRDKTADLVDCSYLQDSSTQVNEWRESTVQNVIKALIKPFDIELIIDSSVASDAAKIVGDKFKVDESQTVFNLIDPLLKQYGILGITTGDGKLTLTRAGTSKANDSLEFGVNIKSARFTQSNLDRFSLYRVYGQGHGNDNKTIDDFRACSGELSDSIVGRYRPFVILSETATTNGKCKDRATWEAENRAGKSRMVEYEVQGHVQSNGEIWPLNSLVSVSDSFLTVPKTMLIAGVSYVVDDSAGTITRLRLVSPNTYKLLKVPIADIDTGFVNPFDNTRMA